MFDIRYLSTANLDQIADLKMKMPYMTEEGVAAARLQITEIEAKTKPYKECNIDECMELRSQIMEKMNKLFSVNRMDMTNNFRMFLKEVDVWIEHLVQVQAAQEEETIKQRIKRQLDGKKKSPGEIGSSTGQGMWSIPFGHRN